MQTTSSQAIETRIMMSDPTPLGVLGLAIVTLVAGAQKMGFVNGVEYVIPWALLLGSAAQIWASATDFKKNNFFGANVLGAYGLFWAAVALHWAISLGWLGELKSPGDPRPLAFACVGYTIFSVFVMIAAFETNKIFATILVLINVLLPSLALSLLHVYPSFFKPLAGVTELLISALSFYASGAVFLNGFFGKVILPLGKPMGWIRKAS